MRVLAKLGLVRAVRRRQRRVTQRRLQDRGWYDPNARSAAAAIFIGGCSRSGTTLLRELLGRHPTLAAGVETSMLVPAFGTRRIAERCQLDRSELDRRVAQSANLVAFAEWFYEQLLAYEGKQRWVDKSPYNVREIAQILTWFPNGRFLHVVRDGRDVACSLRTHPRRRIVNGLVVPVVTDRPVASCARTWVEEVSAGLRHRGRRRLRELRYEALVNDPEAVMRDVCGFLDEPFVPGMLEPQPGLPQNAPVGRFVNTSEAAGPIFQSSVGRWRRDLNQAQRRSVWREAGELLVTLGYVKDNGWIDEPVLRGNDSSHGSACRRRLQSASTRPTGGLD